MKGGDTLTAIAHFSGLIWIFISAFFYLLQMFVPKVAHMVFTCILRHSNFDPRKRRDYLLRTQLILTSSSPLAPRQNSEGQATMPKVRDCLLKVSMGLDCPRPPLHPLSVHPPGQQSSNSTPLATPPEGRQIQTGLSGACAPPKPRPCYT